MPSIDIAMARSVRDGGDVRARFMDLLAASIRPAIESRDAVDSVKGHVTDVKTAFSSWDNCMEAAYCKWPAIALIVIGGLILISIIWCIVRCACCGLSCCCQCCYCLKCCGNCCGCCDTPRGRKHKYLDEPYIPPHHAATHGYKSQEPMNLGPVGPTYSSPRTAEPPQYAEFDASKKGGTHEDALPEMPSWESANSKKVLVEGEAVELDQLNKPVADGAGTANGGQHMPLMAGATGTPGPASPVRSPDHANPYGPPGHPATSGGYLAAGGAGGDPYEMDAQAMNGAYGQRTPPLGADQGYGMAGAGAAMAGGRRSPRDYQDGGYGQDRGHTGAYPAHGDFDDQSRQNPYDDYGQHPNQGFGMGPGRRSPPRGNPSMRGDPGYGGARRSPAPRGDYGHNGNYNSSAYQGLRQQQPSPDPSRAFRQPPQRQFSQDVPPSPTSLQNNGGFDFSSGYSRRPSPAVPPPQQPPQQQAAYPGYRAYQPSQGQEGWSGI